MIGPPLRGNNWVVGNGCCDASPHRGAMLAFDQRLEAAERYAIDWIRTDDQGHLVLPDENNTENGLPGLRQADHLGGRRQGRGRPGQVPRRKAWGIGPEPHLKDAGGNHVIVDIGGGRYAFYAHLKPNSITVKEGDRVRRRQVLALLGNSGNTSAPHLHFHLMDAPLPLGADNNLPYVFDRSASRASSTII